MPITNEFENLPLSQVDLKVTLPQPVLLGPLELLQAAEPLRARFSAVMHDHAIDMPPGVVALPEFPNALQFVRFIDPSRSILATLHTQMIALRWSDFGLRHPYPRYREMLDELAWVMATWSATSATEVFPVTQITYQNFIEHDPNLPPLWFFNQDLIHFDLPDLHRVFDIQLSFRIEGADARVAVTEGSFAVEGKEAPGLILQTIVGTLEPMGSWTSMMDYCHDKSNELFEKILSKEAKQKWNHKQ